MIRQPIITVMGHVDHGKCVSGDTVLQLSDGRLMTAESAFEKFQQGSPLEQNGGILYESNKFKLLSIDNSGDILPRNVTHVWKLKTDRLIHITTKPGYEISTTPEHKFLVFTEDGDLEYRESSELKLGDSLLIPSKTISSLTTISEIKKQIFLKLDDSFLVQISPEFNDKIAEYCKDRTHKIGEKIGDRNLYFHIQNRYYRPSILRKLLKLIQSYDPVYVYDQVELIKSTTIKRRAGHTSLWIKIPHSLEELKSVYYLIGLLFGDGVCGTAYLSNTSNVIIDQFNKCLISSFGVSSTKKWDRTAYVVSHKGGRTLSRFLNCVFGYPETDKTRTLEAPDIICMAPNPLLSEFIQGFFDAEGFAEAENNNGNVGVGCESHVLMKQLPILLSRFGCSASFVKRKNRTGLELRISGSINLSAFRDNIGFNEPRKSDQLEENIKKSVSNRLFDITPINGKFVKEFRQKYKVNGKRDFQISYYESKSNLTAHSLSRLLMLTKTNEQSAFLLSILDKYKIIQVTDLKMLEGDFNVYDFTIEETHNFLANGMIVHNTSLLDKIRNTVVASREAGGITQHIGASEVPVDVINKICGPLMKKMGISLSIPGLLFIDTPGHEAFTNLRRRGGSISDLAILVVDVTKQFEPQTVEAIEILKEYKTPFIVAANKIDLITGWRNKDTYSFSESIESQQQNVVADLEAKIYTLVGSLSEHGFSSERYDRVTDVKKEISIIPLSAKTGEGIAELLMFVAGLSQRFLEKRLEIDPSEPGMGGILELKEEKGLGLTLDAILYNGTLKVNDVIAFATPTGVKTAKIRSLLRPKPLQELKESSGKFYSVDFVSAAAGVKISGSGFEDALAGSLIVSTRNPNYEKEINAELAEVFESDSRGIILKADTIGSIEAISRLLKASETKISKKALGKITKRDVLDAFSMRSTDPHNAVVLAFNVSIEDDAKSEAEAAGVDIIRANVIYKLIDDYKLWLDNEKKRERDRLEKELLFPGKIKILPNSMFRASHPAVFGVEVMAGRIRPSYQMMKENGEIIGRVKEIQDNAVNKQEAKKGDSVAISMNEVTYGRQIKENDILYTFISNEEIRALKFKFKDMLNDEDIKLLDTLSSINTTSGKVS